ELLDAPQSKITVVHHGLDPTFSPRGPLEQAQARAQHGLAGPFILWVGTLEPRKNVPLLLHAFRALRASRPDVELALAGGRGWLDAPVMRLLESPEFGRGVRLLGHVPSRDLSALYSAAVVFAFPSR